MGTSGKKNQKSPIVFVTLNQDTFSNPTLFALFQKLVLFNKPVILLCPPQSFPNPFPQIEIITIPSYYISRPKFFFRSFNRTLTTLPKYLTGQLFLLSLAFKLKPQRIVGIDPLGIIMAQRLLSFIKHNLSKTKQINLDYISFEIFFGDECKVDKLIETEIKACQKIDNLIIQDQLRERLVRKEKKIPTAVRSFFIPVSPITKISESSKQKKAGELHQRYGLTKGQKFFLHFGTVDRWTGAEMLIETIEKGAIADNALYIHSRFKKGTNKYLDKISELSKSHENIIFSDVFIEDQQEMLTFVSQFDAGFCLYVPDEKDWTGKNIFHIGLSSGKFSTYMAANLPTISSALPSYNELNKRYHFGYTVDNSEDICEIIANERDFGRFRANCKKLYDSELDPEEPIKKYLRSFL